MSSLNTISNWYKYSQIEYFTPFMKLWLAFNSWYKQFIHNVRTDRDAINEIKTGSVIKNNFEQLIDASSDDAKELREAFSVLVQEIRIQGLTNESGTNVKFAQSDIEPDFRDLSKKSKTRKLNTGDLIELDENTVVTSNKSILFQEVLEIIYQIRCHLIHGNFDIENQRAHRLVRGAFIVLNKIFSPSIPTT